MRLTLYYLLSSLFIIIQSTSLDDFIEGIESLLRERKIFLEKLFLNKCNSSLILNCTPSYLSCVLPEPPYKCNSKFERPECLGCFTEKGIYVDESESTVSIINQLEEVTIELTETVCLLTSMDEIFINDKERFPFGWQYIGTANGVFRTYPGHVVCNYDPRERPWYLSSATGSKNLAFIFDNSKSLTKNGRSEIEMSLVENIVNYLSLYDFFGGVVYSQGTYKQIVSNFLRGNTVNKKEFIDKIKQINFNNSNTYYTNAFEKVFESFTSLTHISLTQNIIIFITNEHQNDNNSFSITELISSIQLLEIKYNITPIIISYVIGDNSTYVNIINQLCCKYSGFTETIIDSSEIKEKVEKLFSFLANDLNITQVVWTEPYQDSDGLGMLTTAAIPFYDRALAKLIGVVGVDVLLNTVLDMVSENEFIDRISQNLIINNKMNNQCNLQLLRGKYICENDECCILGELNQNCNAYINVDPFKERQQLITLSIIQNCCGKNICEELVSSIYSHITKILIGICVIVGVVLFFCWKNSSEWRNLNEDN